MQKQGPCFPELEKRLHNVNFSLSNWITSLKLLQFLLSLKAKATQEKRAERKRLKEKQWQMIQLEKVPTFMAVALSLMSTQGGLCAHFPGFYWKTE